MNKTTKIFGKIIEIEGEFIKSFDGNLYWYYVREDEFYRCIMSSLKNISLRGL